MIRTLNYGAAARVRLDLLEGAVVADCAAPARVEEDVASAAGSALESPLDFPPLRKATVPGDHVVLALGPGVPQAAELVAAVVPELIRGGVAVDDITVLWTRADADSAQ